MTWLGAREESHVDENLVSTGRRSATERIAALIIMLYKRLDALGLVINGAMPFPLTQQHIADMLGLSLVHTNKSLAKLRRLGMYERTNGTLLLTNPRAFESLGQYFEQETPRAAADLATAAHRGAHAIRRCPGRAGCQPGPSICLHSEPPSSLHHRSTRDGLRSPLSTGRSCFRAVHSYDAGPGGKLMGLVCRVGAAALVPFVVMSGACVAQVSDQDLAKIETVVVIYAENRSFDHLYGHFPGANGIDQATEDQKTQLDHDGTPLRQLTIFNIDKVDDRFPRMPNKPFPIEEAPISQTANKILPSPIHAFFHNKEQINGGRNNMFAAMSTVGGWTVAYFDGSKLKSWQWAKDYTLADNFFMGAFGVCPISTINGFRSGACTPRFDDAPPQDARQFWMGTAN